VPHKRDLADLRIHLAQRDLVERELAVGVGLGLGHEARGGLVVVDLPHAVGDLRDAVDVADDLVRVVQRERDARLEADGHVRVERRVARVIVAHRLLADRPVVVGAAPLAHDAHLVAPLGRPGALVGLDDLIDRRHATRPHLAVEPLERLVHAAAHERLDAARPAGDLQHVGELVLLRAGLERLDTGMRERGHGRRPPSVLGCGQCPTRV